MKKKVLVIVAHPDDETIWMGGMLLQNCYDWDLTILSLCRKNDRDRAPKFGRVCKIFSAKSIMEDLEDDKLNDISINEVVSLIKKNVSGKYDLIFTHGQNGEYGHKRHIDVHKAVVSMLKRKELAGEVFFFSYVKKGKFCYALNADKFIKLDNKQFKSKKEMIRKIYGFDSTSFECKCCGELESFKVGKI